MKDLGNKILLFLKNFFHRKRMIRYGIYFSLIILIYLCRYPILRYAGNRLITEDELQKTEYCFVLGGSSYERGIEAAKLYKGGFARKFVCLGENIPNLLKITGDTLTEAEVSALNLINCGIPEQNIITIKKSTSTQEEIEEIYNYCNANHISELIILSSKFHLRRVRNEVRKHFDDENFNVILHGAPAVEYKEEEWWKYEQGMITVNNEYMKLFWYWWN